MTIWLKSMEKKWDYIKRQIEKTGEFQTYFLDPAQRGYLEKKAEIMSLDVYCWPRNNHERQCLVMSSRHHVKAMMGSVISIEDEYKNLKHKDILGALMSIGLKREEIGDLVFQDGNWYIMILNDAVAIVLQELRVIKDQQVKPLLSEMDPPEQVEIKGMETSINLSSFRLDNVVKEAYGLKRPEAQNLIIKGKVKVNHVVETKSSQLVNEHALISVSKYGRVKLEGLKAQTKKGRYVVKVNIYEYKR